jgi:hypothetical protein
MVTQAGDPIPLTPTTSLPPTVPQRPDRSVGKEGGKKTDPAIAPAAEFLQNLPAPWAPGAVTAKAYAAELVDIAAAQGWHLDDHLMAKLAEPANGVIHHPVRLLLHRIRDLPKAPRPAVRTESNLPRWCGSCGDGNPAAQFNAKFRTQPGSKKPCRACHPDHQPANAA